MKMSDKRIDDYIDNILVNVKNKFKHDKIRLEILDHIESKIEYLLDEGQAVEEATVQALAEMGDSSEIGHELNKIYKFRYDLITIVSRVMLLIGLISFINLILWPIGGILKEEINYQKMMNLSTNQLIELKDLDHKKINIKASLGDDIIKFDRILWNNNSNDIILRKNAKFNFKRISFKNSSYNQGTSYCKSEGCLDGVEIKVPNKYFHNFEEGNIIFHHYGGFITLKEAKTMDEFEFILKSGEYLNNVEQRVIIDDIQSLIGGKE